MGDTEMRFSGGDIVETNEGILGTVFIYCKHSNKYVIAIDEEKYGNEGTILNDASVDVVKTDDDYVVLDRRYLKIGTRYKLIRDEYLSNALEGICRYCIHSCKEECKEECPLFRERE